MTVTRLHCERCATVRAIRFRFLLADESSLGTRVECAHCSHVAFTLLAPARIYCDICDEIRPGLMETLRGPAADRRRGAIVQCGVCHDGKAVLFSGDPQPEEKTS